MRLLCDMHWLSIFEGVFYTGGSVNPARSIGPCVVLRNFYQYHWVSETLNSVRLPGLTSIQIYWVGPILGSLLASGFYKFMKMLEYETANPGQDFDEKEHEHFDPEKDTSRPAVAFAPNGDPMDHDHAIHHGEAHKIEDQTENSYYDPNGTAPRGSHEQGPAGRGKDRHVAVSAMKGGRKDPGFSPAGDAVKSTPNDMAGSYREGPWAEAGGRSPLAQEPKVLSSSEKI